MQSFEPDDSPGAVEIVEQGRAVAPLRQSPENTYDWPDAKSREKIANGILSVWLVGAMARAPFAWNGHCAHCDLRRPVMRRVEVEVEE